MAGEPTDSGVLRRALPGIGALWEVGRGWRLVYERCEHRVDVARLGLEDPRRAERFIRRNYAHCLQCRLEGSGRSPYITTAHAQPAVSDNAAE